jgi:hypothetical protein
MNPGLIEVFLLRFREIFVDSIDLAWPTTNIQHHLSEFDGELTIYFIWARRIIR